MGLDGSIPMGNGDPINMGSGRCFISGYGFAQQYDMKTTRDLFINSSSKLMKA
jgi:hypothetical protein